MSNCCLGRIRTLTGGTRIRCATITPQGNIGGKFTQKKDILLIFFNFILFVLQEMFEGSNFVLY